MTHKDFNNVFENLDYTSEFKQKMEEKLSAKAGFIHSTNENADYVSGVERVEGNRIIYKIVTVAASIAVIAGGVGLAARIGKTPIVDNPMPPTATNATYITDTTDTTTETTTEAIITDENDFIYKDKYNYPLTDLQSKDDAELLEIGNAYYEAALQRFIIQYGAATSLFTLEQPAENEMLPDSFEDFFNYHIVNDENINSVEDIKNMYYSVFDSEWEFNKDDRFTEYNDTLYYHISPAPSILCNIFYNGWDIKLDSVNDNEIKYTIIALFNDGIEYDKTASTVELPFTLINVNGEWKVADFTLAISSGPDETPPTYSPIELIDEENMTDEELAETLKEVICNADKYTYHSVTPYQYSGEVYYRQYEADPEAIGKAYIEYAVEKGWCFPADRNWWIIPDNKTKQTLYDEIYMRFTEDYKTNFENLVIEKNGKAYYEEVAYGDATAFIVDYNNIGDVKIKSRNNERIVADVYFDYSSYVIRSCWEQLSELGIDENYKYMYPQEVELIKTVHGWRINKYIPYAQLRDEALENCEILNEARMLSNPMYKFVGTWRQSAFPDKDYEVVVNSAEKLPDGQVYADIELKNFEVFDDFRTQIDYNEDVVGAFYITGKNGEKYHCNFNLQDDGTIYFYLMEENELESHGVMCFTFDEKIA